MSPNRSGPRRLTIRELGLLIAGIAVGLRLIGMSDMVGEYPWYAPLVGVLGGMAAVGPPILLWERRRRRRRWGPGETLWFTTGVSAWLLWPPIIYHRVRPPGVPAFGNEGAAATFCFLYGTPLMALHVVLVLLCGGWIRRRGRRRRPLCWRDRFGLILGGLWAATGLWVLYMIYTEEAL